MSRIREADEKLPDAIAEVVKAAVRAYKKALGTVIGCRESETGSDAQAHRNIGGPGRNSRLKQNQWFIAN